MVLVATLSLVAGTAALAQGTKIWTQSKFEEFEKGTPQGVAISNDGKLVPGPVVTEVGATPSTFVWSVATATDGTVYVATGSPATVLRVDKDKTAEARFTKIFESKALAVQVLRMGPDGALYAATIPDGRVFRIKIAAGAAVLNETTAEVVFDLSNEHNADSGSGGKAEAKAHYIWDMTFDSAGKLYMATGGPGAVYRVDVSKPKPLAEVFFKTDEQHIRSLAWDKQGNLIAGSDGSGLVYRISPSASGAGKGYVLFSAPRREVTSVAVGADGTIYAADVGDKSHNPLPPLPLASGGAGITISFVQPGSVQAANASLSVPEGSEIYAIQPEQAARKIWSDKDAVVYRMAAGAHGLTVLTGNRGRIYRIQPDGTYCDQAHLEAQQAVAMEPTGGGLLIGTANTGKLYELRNEIAANSSSAHAYASDVLDAGALARWGRVEVDPGSKGYGLWTRSGNVEQPARSQKDWGWSDWQPVTADKVVSPAGRYLQWKVELRGDGEVGGVGVNYLPVNSAPAVDDLVVVPGARFVSQPAGGSAPTVTIAFANPNPGPVFSADGGSAAGPIQAQKDRTAVTVRWAAHDDNGDDLSYDLYLRGDGEHVWRLLKKDLTEKVYSFDGTSFPDGGYQIRVVASDAPSHGPGGGLTGELFSERFELDTTAPVISGLRAEAAKGTITVTFAAADAASTIGKAEYSLDAGAWQYVEPLGGLSDSKAERYAFAIPLPAAADVAGEHLVTVRVYDRRENMATGKVVVGGGQ